MREIEFRLFNKNTGLVQIMTLAKLMSTTFRNSQFEFRGRFTGLKDKNGVKIFEGDIVREIDEYFSTDPEFVPEVLGTYVIKYDGNGFWPYDRDANEYGFNTDGYGSYFEVIGNIYENPELIK